MRLSRKHVICHIVYMSEVQSISFNFKKCFIYMENLQNTSFQATSFMGRDIFHSCGQNQIGWHRNKGDYQRYLGNMITIVKVSVHYGRRQGRVVKYHEGKEVKSLNEIVEFTFSYMYKETRQTGRVIDYSLISEVDDTLSYSVQIKVHGNIS